MIDFPFPPRRHIANPELPSAKIVETWDLIGSEVLYLSEKEHLAKIEHLKGMAKALEACKFAVVAPIFKCRCTIGDDSLIVCAECQVKSVLENAIAKAEGKPCP